MSYADECALKIKEAIKTVNEAKEKLGDAILELEEAERSANDASEDIDDLTLEVETANEDIEHKKHFPYLNLDDQFKCDVLLEYWDKIKLEDIDKMVSSLSNK